MIISFLPSPYLHADLSPWTIHCFLRSSFSLSFLLAPIPFVCILPRPIPSRLRPFSLVFLPFARSNGLPIDRVACACVLSMLSSHFFLSSHCVIVTVHFPSFVSPFLPFYPDRSFLQCLHQSCLPLFSSTPVLVFHVTACSPLPRLPCAPSS